LGLQKAGGNKLMMWFKEWYIMGLNKKKLILSARSYLLLSIGALMMAVNFNVFIFPHQLAPGGITGATLIITSLTGWRESVVLLGAQGVMMFIGFWFLGRFRFLTRTLYVSIVYSTAVGVLKYWLPAGGITDDLLLNTIYGAIVGGVALGLVFLGNGNVAGTSVVSRLVQLKTGMPISQVYIFVDGGLILFQGAIFGWDKALYGMLMLFIWGMAADYVQEGPSVVRTIFVITDRSEQISMALFEKLHVGVTAWSGTGMFTYHRRDVLFCTVSRTDVSFLKTIVAEVDPTAFIVVGQGHQAVGGVFPQRQIQTQPPPVEVSGPVQPATSVTR
jgi:uncharacterized membrane-anchored protein YitT (DUF2179 family)